MKATFEQARDFIEGISIKDNVAIITDHDPDGFTSGILFYDFCLTKKAHVEQFTYSRGTSSVEDFPLSEFNKIITTDLAASMVKGLLEKYQSKKILYMDHHPIDDILPDSVLEYRTLERGYIPSARSAYELAGGKRWVALTGTIADAAYLYPENKEFIEISLKEISMSLEEFISSVLVPFSNSIIFLNERPNEAFSILRKIKTPKDLISIEKYSKPIEDEAKKVVDEFEKKKENLEGAEYYYFETKYPIKSKVNVISLKEESKDKIFIFATPKSNGKISISARNQSKKSDMATLLKEGIKGLDAQAGGHRAASGATLKVEDLETFKNNIRNFLKQNPIK